MSEQEQSLQALRCSMDAYAPISDLTWSQLTQFTKFKRLEKSAVLYPAGVVPTSFAYVAKGLLRCFICDEKGTEYNKLFFNEGMFPGSMTALLTASPSQLAFEAIEDCALIEIDFARYRQLMLAQEDLKLFQIYYLEKNWLLAKDAREIEIVQQDAKQRYLQFVEQFPHLVNRLPQYHIAAHLGITPTQLSRIRKTL